MISAEELARGRQLLDALKAAQQAVPEHDQEDCSYDCPHSMAEEDASFARQRWRQWCTDVSEHMLVTIEKLQCEKRDAQ